MGNTEKQRARRDAYRNMPPVPQASLSRAIQELESFFNPIEARRYSLPLGFGVKYVDCIKRWKVLIEEYRRLRLEASQLRSSNRSLSRLYTEEIESRPRWKCRKRLAPLARALLKPTTITLS